MEELVETFETWRRNKTTVAQPGEMKLDGGLGIGGKRENKGNQNGMGSDTFPCQEMVEPNLATPGSMCSDKSKLRRVARNI